MNVTHLDIKSIQKSILEDIDVSNVSMDAFVGMKVGNEGWLVDLAFLSEVAMPPSISKPGRCPKWVLGIGGFHGEVFSLIDMEQILTGSGITNVRQSWLTLFNRKVEGNMALLWPTMVGLVSKSELNIIESNSLPRFCRQMWCAEDHFLWKELDIDALISSEYIAFDKQ